jgi:ribosomal protein L9
MEDIIITTCRRTFGQHKSTNNNRKNSVPWWNNHLIVMRKKVNANRRLFQRIKNDVALRERRKEKYKEAKGNYQAEINKTKINSWKEFCNVEASVNPWSQVYKIVAGKKKRGQQNDHYN